MEENKAIVSSWDEFLGEDVNEPKFLEIPVGKKIVRVGSLSSAEILEFLEDQATPERRNGSTGRLIARSLVDAEGTRIGNPEDVAKLHKKSPSTMLMIRDKIFELNGLVLKKAESEIKND